MIHLEDGTTGLALEDGVSTLDKEGLGTKARSTSTGWLQETNGLARSTSTGWVQQQPILTVTGSLSCTEPAGDTPAFTGDVFVSGTFAATEVGNDTVAISGDVVVSGAFAATEIGSDTAAITGAVLVSGALSAQESGVDTPAFAGVVTASAITGDLAAQEEGSDVADFRAPVVSQPGAAGMRDQILPVSAKPWLFDDRDILDVMPIIVGIINAQR